MEKTIKVNEEDWERLWSIKIKLKMRKIANVISWLLKNNKND